MKILLVVYDNGAQFHVFPIGTAYIAGMLRTKGYDVEIYNQDVNHYPADHLTYYLNRNRYDAIGIGIIGGYYQYQVLLKLSKAINNSKQRPYFIIAGHGPSPEPEYFLRKTGADVVVIGEGELTIVDLLETKFNNRDLSKVQGIAYIDNEKLIQTERRPLIHDIDNIPFPAYDLFPVDYYKIRRGPRSKITDFSMDMIAGRGCNFECNFCYRLDKGLRTRTPESVIDEIELLKKNYGITYIAFQDDLLMFDLKNTTLFCEALIKADVNIAWNCNGRLNYATDELLSLMRKSGCVFINYGIESLSPDTLKVMKKGLTVKMIHEGIEKTLAHDISPGLNIIFGNINETKEALQSGVDFLLKYDDGSQFRTIRPVTPYPGSPLYYYAIEKGLLKGPADFYENKHLNSDLMAVNFTNLTDDEFYEALLEANTTLINNYFEKKKKSVIAQATHLYKNKDVNFRGFRHT